MVSWLSILCMVVTLLIVFGIPIGLTIHMKRKQNISVVSVFVGALMFIIFQIIIRIPLLSYVQSQSWYSPFASQNLILTGLLIAVSAGLFETAGRYIGLKFLMKNNFDRKNAIAYGIGHGGVEAIYIVGITYVINLIVSIMMNSGSISDPSLSVLSSTSPDMFLAAGLERLFTMLFHIALSLLVYYGIAMRRKAYILLCFLIHSLVDGMVIVFQIYGIHFWAIEACVAIVGLLSLIFIIKSRKQAV